jgi:opacity protein-like surface antigen
MRLRAIVGLFILLAFAGTASAQVQPSVMAGVNLATTSGDIDEDDIIKAKMRAGAAVGVGVSFPTGNDRVMFDLGFLYSQEGAKAEGGGVSGTFKLDYIRIPMLFRIGVGSGSGAYLLAGGSAALLVRARGESEGESVDIKDEQKPADFGLAVGAGANIKNFFLQGTYTFGTIDVNKQGTSVFTNRNQLVQLLVGVRF